MRAAVYYGARDVRVEEVPEPAPRAGEALLRVLRSGVCGTDATEWSSGPKTFPIHHRHRVTKHHGPMIPGHEFVGEVIEPAEDGHFGVGTIVVSGAGVSCGSCGRCLQGRTNLCEQYYTLGLNTAGGMAEMVSVPESVLARVPDAMPVDHAGLAQPMAVGLHAARRSGVRSGERVVLIGAGAIGTFVLAGLQSLAEADVTVIDFPGPRLDRAGRLGATRTIEAGPDAAARVRDILNGPADIVVEASGAPGQLNNAIDMVRAGGTILQVGLPSKQPQVDVHALVMREISVLTTLAHICADDLGPALKILESGQFACEVLQSVHPLEQLPEQLELLATGRLHGKVLFDPACEGELR